MASRVFIIFAVLAASLAQAAETLKTSCPSKAMGLKNCRIGLGETIVQVRDDTISVNTGKNRFIDKLKKSGPQIEWQSVLIFKIAERTILDFRMWDKPEGDINIQSLRWIVYEIQGDKLVPQLDEVIGRRRIATKKLIDPVVFGTIKKASAGKLEWSVDIRKGEF